MKEKKRKGAFWEDRYHATAVETGEHLLRCIVYIDLNMVRAGVVNHPSEWMFGGYDEIQSPRRKCVLIAYEKLAELTGCGTYDSFQVLYKNLISESISSEKNTRDSRWTHSIAIGSEPFLTSFKASLGVKAMSRKIRSLVDGYEIRESEASYNAQIGVKMGKIGPDNTYCWSSKPTNSEC